MYAIKQRFWNNNGKKWVKTLERRYESFDAAQRTATRSYQWIAQNPVTREVLSVSDAEVVEVVV